jgi:DNA (cytosine-5)-methyltransferase 1
MTNKKLNVLDLFCGCGGLSKGFIDAGFNIVAGIDSWPDALETFKRNHPDSQAILCDLANFAESKEVIELPNAIDVVIGGPPCQGFSISGKRDPKDPRNLLYKSFRKVVETLSPKAFVLENVPNLVSMANGEIKNQIISDFASIGYDVSYKVLLASDFNVPQNRRRVFIVGTKVGKKFNFPTALLFQDKVTCADAISDLTEGSVADGSNYPTAALTDYQRTMRNNSIGLFNHQVTNHDPKTISIISKVPDGGNYKDLPLELRDTRKVNIAWTRYSSNKPSFTIDTGHRHHFHYSFNRVPTVRESARLQSFPDTFIFSGSKTSQYKQVGNAVPPLLAQSIAISLMKVLSENFLKKDEDVSHTPGVLLQASSY